MILRKVIHMPRYSPPRLSNINYNFLKAPYVSPTLPIPIPTILTFVVIINITAFIFVVIPTKCMLFSLFSFIYICLKNKLLKYS